MEKKDKERCIFELRTKELDLINGDIGALNFKLFAGFASIFAFLVVNKVLLVNDWISILSVAFVFFICLTWVQIQIDNYWDDCYRGLEKAVMKNKLIGFNISQMKWWHFIYYKRKYELKE